MRASHAFTLIELMISIALVLFLILGVNQVFTYTTQAVGAGEAVNSAIRYSRAAQATFAGDFSAIVPNGNGPNDSACLIIGSRSVYAFRDAKDQAAMGTLAASAVALNTGANGLPLAAFLDLNGNGLFGETTVNGEVVYPATYNFRNHRLDVLSFFARDLFQRQTGNLGTFVDNMASQEAWIWYGHLWLPDNSGNYPFGTYPNGPTGSAYPPGVTGPLTLPGAGTASTNPNNYFASQFVLGRQAILLTEKSPPDTTGVIKDNSGFVQRFIDRPNYTSPPSSWPRELSPLASNSSAAIVTGDTNSWWLQDGRFDLAATTIAAFRSKLSSYLNPLNSYALSAILVQPLWFDWMMDGNINPPSARPFVANAYTRFKCNPFVAKPMTSVAMAQASPYFLGGCSQFIVEFAGDFLTQDNNPSSATYGQPIQPTGSSLTDGQIDYTLVNGSKQIKWYGLPRNTSGLSGVKPLNGDVAPLNAWIVAYGLTSYYNYTFEKIYPAVKADYSGAGGMSLSDAQNGYTCAFGPNDPHPKLIRITMTLDDPTGRLPEGQTYQYVFALP